MIDVVILTEQDDIHALAVRYALLKKGATVRMIFPGDLPINMIGSIEINDSPTAKLTGLKDEYSLKSNEDIGIVWYRRTPLPVPSHMLSTQDRVFVKTESQVFFQSIFYILSKDAKHKINIPITSAIANLKPIQLIRARQIGFQIPRTLVSNNASDISKFVRSNDTQKIHKSFTPYVWTDPERKTRVATYTQFITTDEAEDSESMQATPAIFQEYIERHEELKVFVFGKEIHCVSVISKSACDSRTDKLRSYVLPDVALNETERSMIQDLMDVMELAVATLDFIRTATGNLVFLEINESGQWLFMENGVPNLMLLDKFTNYLISLVGKDTTLLPSVSAKEALVAIHGDRELVTYNAMHSSAQSPTEPHFSNAAA